MISSLRKHAENQLEAVALALWGAQTQPSPASDDAVEELVSHVVVSCAGLVEQALQ